MYPKGKRKLYCTFVDLERRQSPWRRSVWGRRCDGKVDENKDDVMCRRERKMNGTK